MSRSGRRDIERGTEAGERAARRLETERVIWMTTVDADGMPQTSPVWFVWDGERFLVYSLESPRATNVAEHAPVSLNLDGNGLGGDIVVVEGTAVIDGSRPPASENGAYLEKYGSIMESRDWSPEWFAGRYSIPIVITPSKYRYW